MAKAEGRQFDFKSELAISDELETFDAGAASGAQLVSYTNQEFSAVCPFSGLPDLGTVIVQYVPGKKIAELKSLKYYFTSFRQVGVYQEKATSLIFRFLLCKLEPRWLRVATAYRTRGGIDTTCMMDTGREFRPDDADLLMTQELLRSAR